MSAPTKLRQLLYSPELVFLMEAHNALSAKIVEKTGFKGIWASGLTVSTSYGLRDSNEMSFSQLLDVLGYMSSTTALPILVDGDTGYGDFNNVRICVKNLCRIGIEGFCIEDKIFPKMNSFINSYQDLANINEFCGKIKAAKDAQLNDDFCLIARIEALIAGAGMEEALRRAEAYYNSGADAILIHSKLSVPDEVFSFMRYWGNRCPVIIVPTKYYTTPVSLFKEANISVVIWANHNLRASMLMMEKICKRIFEEQSISNIEREITDLEEIFLLFNYQELLNAKNKYQVNYENKKNEKHGDLVSA